MSARWSPPDHPRDRRGRFTKSNSSALSESELASARSVMGEFKPRRFANGAEADAYLRSRNGALTESQAGAIDTYTGDRFLDLNRQLRSGEGADDDPTVQGLRGAMRPTEDDLILNRTVSIEAFGGHIDDLAGKKVQDAAFSSTSLGLPYGGNLGNVQIKIAVPKGTPAIFAAPHSRNPNEREVILPDGMEFAVASVTKNDRFGYDMSVIVLPRTVGS